MLCNSGVRLTNRDAESFPVMRCALLRCLVVLLLLALSGGNAHAELHLGAVSHNPCSAEVSPEQDRSVPVHHDQGNHKCCCDCLGCTAAAEVTPPLSSLLAFFGARLAYGDANRFLTGRSLRPEPGPPRSVALS